MFVDYQKVRNAAVGMVAAVGAGAAAIFGVGDKEPSQPKPVPAQVAHAEVVKPSVPAKTKAAPTFIPKISTDPNAANERTKPTPIAKIPIAKPPTAKIPIAKLPIDKTPIAKPPIAKTPLTDRQLYSLAMKLAQGPADKSGTAKDVLGPNSVWKLNLYDDDLDGQYDRSKLDKDRDDIEDEKWIFKKGRWEKDGGATLWLDGRWVKDPGDLPPARTAKSVVSPNLQRYRSAMKIATARADRSGKGKDVLGPRSPWKLNLYDDNKDGQWDRAKLDTNRDEKDDEKWNFKKGRWEKDGGATIWSGSDWRAE